MSNSAPPSPQQPRSARHRFRWCFSLPLLMQLALVVAVPIPKAITLTTGQTVFLATVPVDPYDLLRGRYVTLDYEIAQSSTVNQLPGWSHSEAIDQPPVYNLFITIEPSPTSTGNRPVWKAIAVSQQRPAHLDSHQRIIRGRKLPGRRDLDLGLGQYFIPETLGDRLEADIRAHPNDTIVEAKVDAWGNSALVDLWVEDRRY